MLHGITFQPPAAPAAAPPNRADVALFVGLVHRRREPLPPQTLRWLEEHGWLTGPYRRPARALRQLLDVPVPVESWDDFTRLFWWDFRRLDAGGTRGMGYLAAAVRSFFAQGGRRCYVVRAGSPPRYSAPLAWRRRLLGRLVPGWTSGNLPSPADRASWRGAGHLLGLPEVSYLCVPDLADLVRPDPAPPTPAVRETAAPEGWVECGTEDAGSVTVDDAAWRFAGPRCDEAGYRDWAQAVRRAAQMVAAYAREAQVVASVPLPSPDVVVDIAGRRVAAQDDPLAFLLARRYAAEGLEGTAPGRGIASAFVQLAYPWVRTGAAGMLPEGLEAPEGVLAGVLARNALLRGSWRSAAGLELGDAWALHPEPGRAQLFRAQEYGDDGETRPLVDRVSVLGPTAAGLRLLSDVTTSEDEVYRPAGVGRLIGALVRAARRLGEDSVFEPHAEAAWAGLRDRLDTLLTGMLRAGALRGRSPSEAFEVRCDRTTMSQNDIDSGRIVAVVTFQPAVPVERITVVLASEEGGEVSLQHAGAAREAA